MSQNEDTERAPLDDEGTEPEGAEPEDAEPEDAEPEDAEPEDAEPEDEAEVEADVADDAPPPGEPLLPSGNPLRLVRGGVTIALGLLVAFVLMASKYQFRFGVPVGALAIGVAAFGVLDLIGSFDDPEERVAGRAEFSDLLKPFGIFAGGLGALWLFVCLAVDGRLTWFKSPVLTAAVLIPAAFLVAVLGFYRLGEKLDVWEKKPDGSPRPLLQRHGFWVVVAATLLYLPVLGSHSLSDPWETHYGEVAREILARNDWISLWWAQDGWFWSKPILDFWVQALAMATFGVRYQPGQMLSAMAEGRVPWPEWAVRLPVFLLTLLAVYLLYKAVARVWSRRAGLLGALVLLTMPQWFLVTHQTMTDMPFVAPMAAAMAMFLLGAHEDPDDELRVYELDLVVTKLRFSAFHLVVGGVLVCALPQILYLVSRNVDVGTFGMRIHRDAFSTGSPGNCGLPGNDTCRAAFPVLRDLHPALQGLIWAQALGLFLYMNWGERRRQRLYFLAAWLFAALSTMAKGPAGIGLPVLCALAYLLVSRRLGDLLKMEIASGTLLLLAVALPWFVAMYARHGQPFTDRLLFHDMFKRAFTHVHDTNEGDDVSFRFYVWQLGYAMFPWTGLVPAALLSWLGRREEGERRSDASVFLSMWFVFAFSLFSLMLTKFHHYILPALPPAAMLTGILLDGMIRRSGSLESTKKGGTSYRARYDRAMLGAVGLSGAILLLFVGRDLSWSNSAVPGQIRLLHLFTYNYRRPWPTNLDFSRTLWGFTIVGVILMACLAIARVRRYVVGAIVALGLGFGAWGLDVYFMKTSPHWGQRETMLAYMAENQKEEGQLIAYQMNWKGENFYMGNHVPAFVSSGRKFQDYVAEQRQRGHHTLYFMTEHSRTGSLQNELKSTKTFDKLTSPALNNKFVLVRARF